VQVQQKGRHPPTIVLPSPFGTSESEVQQYKGVVNAQNTAEIILTGAKIPPERGPATKSPQRRQQSLEQQPLQQPVHSHSQVPLLQESLHIV